MTAVCDGARERMAEIDRLEAALADVCGHLNALDARLVELVADALATEAWCQHGIASPAHWLAWKAGLTRSRAQQLVAIARRRSELPATIAAFERGELSVDQVAPIARRVPAWAEAEVSGFARYATVSQLQEVVAKYPFEPEPVPEAAKRGESVSMSKQHDGTWRLSGRLDADHGAIVDAALREAQDALFQATNRSASKAEALVELANRSLDGVTDAGRRDRFRVHVHLDADGNLTDDDGAALPGWLRDLLTCDHPITPIWERHGRPVIVGDTRPTVSRAVRRHVRSRDRSCRVPGCTNRIVHLHHLVHRKDGGTNDPHNLVALCPHHHRLHHQGMLHIAGNPEQPDGLEFRSQYGILLHGGSLARPPTGPPPAPAGRYQHPLGERLSHRDVWFNPPPNPN
jgi:hypothetical protein